MTRLMIWKPMPAQLARVFVGAAVVWSVALPAATLAAAANPRTEFQAFAFAVYGLGSLICHQIPARSFAIAGAPLPVCARCTGIYLGAALAAALAYKGRVGSFLVQPDESINRSLARWSLLAGALPTAVTIVAEWWTGSPASNTVRAAAGVPLGASVALVILAAAREASRTSKVN